MSADRIAELASTLLVAALLIVSSTIGNSTRAVAGDVGNPDSFLVADSHQNNEAATRKQKKIEERLRKQRQKAKQQKRQQKKAEERKRQKVQQKQRQRQKAEERKRQKVQQKQRQRQKSKQQKRQRQKAEERKRQKAQQKQRQRQKTEDKPKKKRRLKNLRKKAQEREDPKASRRQKAQDKKRLKRREQRIRRAQDKREKTRRQKARGNEMQLKRLKKRRSELRNELNPKKAHSERRKRRALRLERQLGWEKKQARRERRRWRRDFGFHRRARIIRRRNDRIIYAGLAAAAIGAVAGAMFIHYDDDVRFGWRARDVYVEPLANGWTRTVVVRSNGVRIITIRDSNGFIVRRYRVFPDNRVTFLYNNQPGWWDDDDLYVDIEPVYVGIPQDRYIVEPSHASVETIYETVTAGPVDELNRTYTLNQVLVNARLRDYMPRIDLEAITFASGSAEIPVDQIDKLETIGVAMEQAIKENSSEVYLLEGHTDAVGSNVANLELSDRRAAAVADVLMQYFELPPENLVTRGYGEQFLKIGTQGPEQRNRRVAIRRVTPLLSKDKSQIAFDDKGNEIIEEGAGQQN